MLPSELLLTADKSTAAVVDNLVGSAC